MANSLETTPWGGRIGKGTGSIEIVVRDIPLGREFTADEVDHEIARRGLQGRGATRRHLETLRDRGFIRRSDNGWVRIQ